MRPFAYSQPPGSGQTAISPLAIHLAQQPPQGWLDLAGKLAMVGVDNWQRSSGNKERAQSLADMLTGGAQAPALNMASQTAAAGGGGYSGPRGLSGGQPASASNRQLAQMLTGNPELMGAFQQVAMLKQFPEFFGGNLQPVWGSEAQQAYVWGQPQADPVGEQPGEEHALVHLEPGRPCSRASSLARTSAGPRRVDVLAGDVTRSNKGQKAGFEMHQGMFLRAVRRPGGSAGHMCHAMLLPRANPPELGDRSSAATAGSISE